MNKLKKLLNPKSYILNLRRLRKRLFPIAALVLVFAGMVIAYSIMNSSSAKAAWFDDNWAYRKAITFTHNATVSSPSQVLFEIDTTDAPDKFQADCGDVRFTDATGNILKYYHVSGGGAGVGCDDASSNFNVLLPSIINGSNYIYMYYGNPQASDGTQLTALTESTTSLSGTPSAGSEEKAPSPTLYWKFDDTPVSSVYQDSSENNLDGAVSGATQKTEDLCRSSKCLNFDGVNDSVTKADDSKLDFVAADNFTVSLWMRSPIASANKVLLTKASANLGSTYQGYKVYMDASGDLCFDIQDGTNAVDTACTSAVDFDDNAWHNVVGVKTGTTKIELYVDGTLRATDSSIASTGSLANSGALYVGIDNDGAANDYSGFIDDVKIYRDNTARTAAQVKPLYSAGTNEGGSVLGANNQQNLSNGLVGYWKMDESSWTNDCSTLSSLDSSGNGLNLRSCPDTTGPTGGATGKFGKGGNFSGSNYLRAGISVDLTPITNLTQTELTASAWIYPTQTCSTSVFYMPIMAKQGGGGLGWEFMLFCNGASQYTLWVYHHDTSGATKADYRAVTTATANNWYHVALAYNSSDNTPNLYFNGSKLTPYTSTQGSGAHADDSGDFRIGNGWIGNIDDARIYNRAEISFLYI